MDVNLGDAIAMVVGGGGATGAYALMRWRLKSLEDWKAKTQALLDMITGSSNPGRGPAFVTPQQCDERTDEIRTNVKAITKTTRQLLNAEKYRLGKEMTMEQMDKVFDGDED